MMDDCRPLHREGRWRRRRGVRLDAVVVAPDPRGAVRPERRKDGRAWWHMDAAKGGVGGRAEVAPTGREGANHSQRMGQASGGSGAEEKSFPSMIGLPDRTSNLLASLSLSRGSLYQPRNAACHCCLSWVFVLPRLPSLDRRFPSTDGSRQRRLSLHFPDSVADAQSNSQLQTEKPMMPGRDPGGWEAPPGAATRCRLRVDAR